MFSETRNEKFENHIIFIFEENQFLKFQKLVDVDTLILQFLHELQVFLYHVSYYIVISFRLAGIEISRFMFACFWKNISPLVLGKLEQD